MKPPWRGPPPLSSQAAWVRAHQQCFREAEAGLRPQSNLHTQQVGLRTKLSQASDHTSKNLKVSPVRDRPLWASVSLICGLGRLVSSSTDSETCFSHLSFEMGVCPPLDVWAGVRFSVAVFLFLCGPEDEVRVTASAS